MRTPEGGMRKCTPGYASGVAVMGAVLVGLATLAALGSCVTGRNGRAATVDHNRFETAVEASADVSTAVQTHVDLAARLTAALAAIEAQQSEINGLKAEIAGLRIGDVSGQKSTAGRDVTTHNTINVGVMGIIGICAAMIFVGFVVYMMLHRFKTLRWAFDLAKGKPDNVREKLLDL